MENRVFERGCFPFIPLISHIVMPRPAWSTLWSLIFLLYVQAAYPQQGYIYLHVNSQDDATSPDFHFTLNGTTNFVLNDLPSTSGAISDIGAGVSGELWAATTTNIYRRPSGSSQWANTGYQAVSIDGAGAGQFVSVDATGTAYFFDGTTLNTIYRPAFHANIAVEDISFGGGRIAITRSDGSILTNISLAAPYFDSWAQLLGGSAGATRLDIQPYTGTLVYLANGVYTIPFTGGASTNIGTSSYSDIAVDGQGQVYANGDFYNGSTWTTDASARSDFNHTTAFDGAVWSSNNTAIYSRTTTSWLDGERIRILPVDNSVIIPLTAGTYQLTATPLCGWKLSGYSIYDPDASTTNVNAISVATGEIVHIVANIDKIVTTPILITGDSTLCANSSLSLSTSVAGGTWSSNNTAIAVIDASGTVNGLTGGTATMKYELNNSGCIDSAVKKVYVSAGPAFTLISSNVSCNTFKDGIIRVTSNSAGNQYAINGGAWQADSVFKGLSPGTYSITVKGANACVANAQSAVITEPDVIGITVSQVSVGCPGDATGSLTAVATGGVAPYTITWSTGSSAPTIGRLPEGTYSITVKDANTCSASIRVKLVSVISVFVINTPVKQVGGQIVITGNTLPNASAVIRFPDGTSTTTHADAYGKFSTISASPQPNGSVYVTVTDASTKATCTRHVDFNDAPACDVSIVKTLETTGGIGIGDEISFLLTVYNKGLDNATSLIITDDFPSNLSSGTALTPSAGYATYNAAMNEVVWNIDTLKVLKSATLSFKARVTAAGVVKNTAYVSSNEIDPDNSNNSSTVATPAISATFFIPNVITPNGDGKNDKFVVKGLDLYPGSRLEIYNRWGNQVYRSDNYNNNWTGEGLSAGIYYYVLKVNMAGGSQLYKGYVELITR
ncbi:gliding motility-associated C-terminal domain-containing protein [Chitinophaga sancti]|uniref:Gliding motility-associated C-terminal domain-containing protein n=1 Tax=Chitinophaga sancti TaxID=1004 RepID=A0A1K1LPC8_9BACT|nr:gliding motility-associated C-terminal domain-containing protein [Chitinophaga sancti]